MVVDVLGEWCADVLLHKRLVAFDQPGQRVGVEIGVLLDTGSVLCRGQELLERISGLFGLGAHIEHDVSVHVDETAVAVVGEPSVAGECRQSFDGVVVQTEVQDRVHHARQGFAGAGTNGHQKRIVNVAETLPKLRLDGR